jgi:hypothetical protein
VTWKSKTKKHWMSLIISNNNKKLKRSKKNTKLFIKTKYNLKDKKRKKKLKNLLIFSRLMENSKIL